MSTESNGSRPEVQVFCTTTFRCRPRLNALQPANQTTRRGQPVPLGASAVPHENVGPRAERIPARAKRAAIMILSLFSRCLS
jgi:hypothetical protein